MINKGGRGKKAPYETTHIRVPLPLKSSIEQLIKEWFDLVDTGVISSSQSLKDMYKDLAHTNKNAYWAINKAIDIAKQKKSAKVSLLKLVNELYEQQFTLADLEIENSVHKDVNK